MVEITLSFKEECILNAYQFSSNEGNQWTYLPWESSPTSIGTELRGSQSSWDWSSGEALSGSGIAKRGAGPTGQEGQQTLEPIEIGED